MRKKTLNGRMTEGRRVVDTRTGMGGTVLAVLNTQFIVEWDKPQRKKVEFLFYKDKLSEWEYEL